MENDIRDHKRQKTDTEINKIIKSIREYKYNNNIDILVKTFEELYKYNKHIIAIDAAGGIKAIVDTMNTHKDNVKVLIAGLLILNNFTDINDNFMSEYEAFTYTDKIIDSGVILSIVRAMETHKNQFDFMIIACDTIAKLTTHKNINIAKILVTGSVLAIVETIRFSNNINQRKVLIAACNALCIFLEYKKITESTDALDYIDCICNVIYKNLTYNEVLIYAIQTLLKLIIKNDINKNRAINAKAISYIIKVMENNIIITNINVNIVLDSCRVINNLINKLSSQKINLYTKTLIAIMKVNPNHKEIHIYLSLVIYKLTLFKKFCIHDEIVKENGIEVLIANIKKYTDNTNIVEYTCSILYYLLTIPSNNTMDDNVINKILEDRITQIITTDCIADIFKAINNFIKNDKVKEYTMIEAAFLLLRKLYSPQANNIMFMKVDYINIIIATIDKYKKDESFVIYCLNFLKYIYCDFPTIKIQSEDIEILVSVMKLNINNTRIFIITCSILSKWFELLPVNLSQDMSSFEQLEIVFLNTKFISESTYNIKNTIANIEDIEVIFEAIEKHRNNTNVMVVCYLILAQYIHIKGDLAIIKIVNMRGVQIAIESLKTYIENKTVRSSVCFLLGTLCKIPNTPYLTKSNKTIQQDVFKTGCIEYAMLSLRQKTNNSMELNNASLLLASISLDNENGEIVNEIINHGGFKVILGAMTTTKHKNRVILYHHICCLIINILIANISHNDSMKFAKEGGIEVVIQIMKDFKNDRGLCSPLKLIYLVSKNKDLLMSIATAIGIEGGFPFLLEFINIRTEDKYDNMVHENTTEILNNLAKEQYILNKMKDENVLEWIKKTMKNNTNMTNETYQRYNDLISILE
jgi:hypothetical protein